MLFSFIFKKILSSSKAHSLVAPHLTPNRLITELFFTTCHPSSSFVIVFIYLWSPCWPARAAIKMADTGRPHYNKPVRLAYYKLTITILLPAHAANKNDLYRPSPLQQQPVRLVYVFTRCLYNTDLIGPNNLL